MSAMVIPNRPFASDLLTGLMMPDGIFVTAFGLQKINAQVQNAGGSAEGTMSVYLESVSHPAIVVTPVTHTVWSLASGATTTVAWEADFSGCPEGPHYVSVIVETAAGKTRLIKKIFVLRVEFDPATATLHAHTPQGTMSARFTRLVGPKGGTCRKPGHGGGKCCCCCDHGAPGGVRPPKKARQAAGIKSRSILEFARLFRDHSASFRFCPPGYLPKNISYTWTPNPAYTGQHGDLPFDDPWWKVVLWILAVLLLIAAAIAEATYGDGEIFVGVGTSTEEPVEDCCGVEASGGGSSYLAAALVAAAAGAATVAVYSDERDAFRRGQDATPPGTPGELTVAEAFEGEITYPEPVELGRPFTVNSKWKYTRTTTAGTYSTSASDSFQNTHVLSRYEIEAPDVTLGYDPDEHWIIKAKFFDEGGAAVGADRLFVQCFLVGPNGEWFSFVMEDDGNWPDEKPNDKQFTGYFPFSRKHAKGLWEYYVIAQDVNTATGDMTPEEAAKIIGGMVLTNQLTLTFDGGECRFVPDGHVNVL